MVEALIVIAIFTVGILAAMTMQTTSATTNVETRRTTLAIEYASDTMERLMRINPSSRDKFNIDDNGDGNVDELAESELNNDGIDNDGDGMIDEADEVEWFRLPEFQAGTGRTRGVNIPEDAYYASMFNLTWDIIDIDCDEDSTTPDDAKRIDITVFWNNGNRFIQLTGIRTNLM